MDQQLLELDSIYDFPWNRIGPYLVGVVTGYILQVKLYEKELVFKKVRLFHSLTDSYVQLFVFSVQKRYFGPFFH